LLVSNTGDCKLQFDKGLSHDDKEEGSQFFVFAILCRRLLWGEEGANAIGMGAGDPATSSSKFFFGQNCLDLGKLWRNLGKSD